MVAEQAAGLMTIGTLGFDDDVAIEQLFRTNVTLDDGTYAMFLGRADGSLVYVDRDVTDQTAILSYENPASDNPWVDLRISLAFSDTLNEQSDASSPIPSPLFFDTDYAYKTWSAKIENTIEHSGADWENFLTIGLQASHQTRIADTALGVPLSFHPEGVEKRLGVYVQDEFVYDQRLTIIPGVRIDGIWTEPSGMIAGASETTQATPITGWLHPSGESLAAALGRSSRLRNRVVRRCSAHRTSTCT